MNGAKQIKASRKYPIPLCGLQSCSILPPTSNPGWYNKLVPKQLMVNCYRLLVLTVIFGLYKHEPVILLYAGPYRNVKFISSMRCLLYKTSTDDTDI